MDSSTLPMLFLPFIIFGIDTEDRLGVGAVGQEHFHLGPGLTVRRVCGSLFGQDGGVLGTMPLREAGGFVRAEGLSRLQVVYGRLAAIPAHEREQHPAGRASGCARLWPSCAGMR